MDIPEVKPVDNEPAQPQDIVPKLLTDQKDMLLKAIDKWIKFNQGIYSQVNGNLENEIRRSSILSMWMRTLFIVISAAITTMSSMTGIPRMVITVIAGTLTALTGIEAYLKLSDRQSNSRKMQRELEHLRDDLRYQWFNQVEVPDYANDFTKRLEAARQLLTDGPEQYNQILDKYTLKADKGDTPGGQGPAVG
jgi:hypothetical protein